MHPSLHSYSSLVGRVKCSKFECPYTFDFTGCGQVNWKMHIILDISCIVEEHGKHVLRSPPWPRIPAWCQNITEYRQFLRNQHICNNIAMQLQLQSYSQRYFHVTCMWEISSTWGSTIKIYLGKIFLVI